MQLREVGMHIHEKRKEFGISQSQLAKLAGLSRTTVNQLETGALEDLGYTKLNHVMGILGMGFNASDRAKKSPALSTAARTASTSYAKILSPETLKHILQSGMVPEDFKPHMMTLLDETPVPLVLSAIREVSVETNTPVKTLMKHITAMAKSLHAHRAVW